MTATALKITITGNGLHVEQMSLRACWHVDHYLSLLLLERERAILGNLRIDLHMDRGPVPIERVDEVMKGGPHGQRYLSAPGQGDILVNRDRLARLHLSEKRWLGASNIELREGKGWIATCCYLNHQRRGEAQIVCTIDAFKNDGLVCLVRQRDIDGKQFAEEVWSTDQHAH